MAQNESIKTMIEDRAPILIDGAMGTLLMGESKSKGVPAEILNILSPDVISDIHEKYIEAGCDIITTNTFGANNIKINEEKYNTSIEEIVEKAVICAKNAIKNGVKDRDVKVALNIGATGQIVGMMDEDERAEVRKMFARQVKSGSLAGADLILIETMSDIEEIKDAIEMSKKYSDLPVFCTMSFDESGKTFMGVEPKVFAEIATEMGADAIGANCSLGPMQMRNIIEEILSNTDKPVIAQPNAGLPKMENGQAVYDMKEEDFARDVCTMIDNGVSIVGGCCGTSPDFIRVLRNYIKKRG